MFLVPAHLLATLDDDLYGTRASDNQVKALCSRKASKEGHSAGAIADALFRVTLAVRFRRRGESQFENVSKMLDLVFEGRGERSLHGFVLTADRGYGRIELMQMLLDKSIGSVCVMPHHINNCHPSISFINIS